MLGYLDAHNEERHDDAKSLFTPDAVVTDDGNTYVGIDNISTWIKSSSSEYEYSSSRIGQRHNDNSHVTMHIRLDGNFPGGTATLFYRFTLDESRIARLCIEP